MAWFGSPGYLTGLKSVMFIVEALIQGFFCSCLYAVARPRLGPGPKTAVVVATSIYLIRFGLNFIWIMARGTTPLGAFINLISGWGTLIVCTYLAGWQYIERAP